MSLSRREALRLAGLGALYLAGCGARKEGQTSALVSGTPESLPTQTGSPSETPTNLPSATATATTEPTWTPIPEITPTPEVKRRPDQVFSIYLSYENVARRDNVLSVLERMSGWQANTIVVDIKNEAGRTNVPFEHEMKPAAYDFLDDPENLFFLVNEAKKRGIHLIARQAVTLDNRLYKNFRRMGDDLGLIMNGRQLLDRSGNYWLDPRREEIAIYNAAVSRAAVDFGFEEIQLDYIRFADADVRFYIDYETRVGSIERVLSYVRQVINNQALLTADFLGISAWADKSLPDAGIGQDITALATYLDGLCPMLYPEFASLGADVDDYAYVHDATLAALERMRLGGNLNAFLNPWIQATGISLEEIKFQTRAAFDAGGVGVHAWNNNLTYLDGLYGE